MELRVTGWVASLTEVFSISEQSLRDCKDGNIHAVVSTSYLTCRDASYVGLEGMLIEGGCPLKFASRVQSSRLSSFAILQLAALARKSLRLARTRKA